MQRSRARWPRFVFALGMTLLFGELVTRWVDHRNHYDPNMLKRIKSGTPSLRGFGPLWYEGVGHETIHDSRGRAHPFVTEKLRIVCLGGSTTEGSVEGTVDNDYPGFLAELRPDVDVVNGGAAGYASVHTIATLAHNALAWQPDVVIVSDGINDQTAAYFPRWQPDLEHKFRNYGPSAETRRIATPLNTIFQGSHFYWWVKRMPRKLELAYRFGSWRGDKPLNSQGEIHTRSYGPTPPQEALNGFRRNMESIVALAAGRTQLIFLTQPYSMEARHWHELLAWRRQWNDVDFAPPPAAEMAAHHKVYNEVVRTLGKQFGVPVIDGESVVTDPKLFADSVHLTVNGNKALAQAVQDGLIHLAIPPRDKEHHLLSPTE